MISLAFQTNKKLSEYGPLARASEDYGFDALSVYNDMLYQPAWLPLYEMAKHTEHLLVGTSGVNPYIDHPISIAGNISLIDEVSNGRAYLGLVRGAWLDFAGIKPEESALRMKEAVECTRHLIAGKQEPYQGKIFQLAGGDSLRWSPVRSEIPMLIGSWGPVTIRKCIPFSWAVKLGGSANPAAVCHYRKLIGQYCQQCGRNPSDVLLATGAVTVVDNDGAAADKLARREVALYLPVIEKVDPTLNIDPELIARIKGAADRFDFETAASYISDEMLRLFAFSGTPSEVIDQASAMIDSGADWVEFGTPHGVSEQRGLHLLGKKVLPELRQLGIAKGNQGLR
jgi:5,10-methylenetetrahydromethanopterin reductase